MATPCHTPMTKNGCRREKLALKDSGNSGIRLIFGRNKSFLSQDFFKFSRHLIFLVAAAASVVFKGVRCGVAERVEDGRRLPALREGLPETAVRLFQGWPAYRA
jgi:hypothetical protein